MGWKQRRIREQQQSQVEISITQKKMKMKIARMIVKSQHQNHLQLHHQKNIIIDQWRTTITITFWWWLVARAVSCTSWCLSKSKIAPNVMANFFILIDLKMNLLESDSLSLFFFFLFHFTFLFFCPCFMVPVIMKNFCVELMKEMPRQIWLINLVSFFLILSPPLVSFSSNFLVSRRRWNSFKAFKVINQQEGHNFCIL